MTMRKIATHDGSTRPVSWCIGGCKYPESKSRSHDGDSLSELAEENHQNRGVLVRSTSFQALHSALARLYRLDDFSLERIGQGFFSEVYKVRHRVTGDIMVLKMNKLMSNRHNMLREVELMNRLHHPNILSYYGVCVHEGQVHALTEYINGGSLDCLVQNRQIDLPWTTRVSLALDISKGMAYLHSRRVFHRDLTSKNVLIKHIEESGKNTMQAVIADFGLAAPIPQDRSLRLRQVGSAYWMAPEVIRGDCYDHLVDVFSFGIILCEMIARCEADPDILPRTNNFGVHYLAFSHMCQNDCPPSFLEIAFQCCQISPESRPTFGELARKLERLLHSMTVDHNRHPMSRKQRACHRRSLSDESIILMKNHIHEGNHCSASSSSAHPIPAASNSETHVGTPQEVLERMSAADPYFQPSSATVNPFNKVKLPAKSQLIVQEGFRCCHSMPDLRNLHLCRAPFVPPPDSTSHLASSDSSLSQGTSTPHHSCFCVQTCNSAANANDVCSSYQCNCNQSQSFKRVAHPDKEHSKCNCGYGLHPPLKNVFKGVGSERIFHRLWPPNSPEVDGCSGTSPRSDTGGGSSSQMCVPCIGVGYVRRRGSGESGFFSVEDMEPISTPELGLSYSELSSASFLSTEDDDLYLGHHMMVHRSSSVVTDSSEDLSSLGCCHDQTCDQADLDERFSYSTGSECSTDIKSIVEFFERGYGSLRHFNESERNRRLGMGLQRKERLVPLLRSKFSSSAAHHSLGGNFAHSKQPWSGNFAQVSSSKSANAKECSWVAPFKQGCRQPFTRPERRETFRVKDRPKVYITEGTVRAKRNIFESK